MPDRVSDTDIVFQKVELRDGKGSLNAVYKINGNITDHLLLPFTVIHAGVEQLIHAHFHPSVPEFDFECQTACPCPP